MDDLGFGNQLLEVSIAAGACEVHIAGEGIAAVGEKEVQACDLGLLLIALLLGACSCGDLLRAAALAFVGADAAQHFRQGDVCLAAGSAQESWGALHLQVSWCGVLVARSR